MIKPRSATLFFMCSVVSVYNYSPMSDTVLAFVAVLVSMFCFMWCMRCKILSLLLFLFEFSLSGFVKASAFGTFKDE